MEKTLEITSAAGTKYQFVEVTIFSTFVSVYAWYRERWNRLSTTFKSFEEAQEWVKELDRKHEAQMNAPKMSYNVPSDYYGRAGVYYGD